MAITQTKKNNLAATKIVDDSAEKVVESVEKPIKENNEKAKTGFLATTLAELKKVKWPNFGYVVRWGIVVILFTAMFSIILGFFDNVFSSSLKFVDCTSTKGRNQPFNDCARELGEAVTLRQ